VPAHASVERISHVGPRRSLGAGISNRMVIAPDGLQGQSPFILLVEDFIGEQADFHEHPHRGLETVTFVLEGALEHGDHLGNTGVLEAFDVQWMTAGGGIVHGGRPARGSSVHALQLWTNLPNALRNATPGTRVQRQADTMVEVRAGVSIRTYGTNAIEPWSRHPITLRYIDGTAGAAGGLAITSEERCFVYILAGAPLVGGWPCRAGDVVWCALSSRETVLPIAGNARFRAVAYSGRPIAEDVVAGGPFVAGSAIELEAWLSDLRAGKFSLPT